LSDDTVSFDVPEQLVFPKLISRLRYRSLAARVLVPETAMHENNASVAFQHKIWASCQLRIVQPKTQPKTVNHGTNDAFWARVFSSDASHHFAFGA